MNFFWQNVYILNFIYQNALTKRFPRKITYTLNNTWPNCVNKLSSFIPTINLTNNYDSDLQETTSKTQLALNKQNSAHTSWNLEVLLNSFLNLRSVCNSEGTFNSPRNAENNSSNWLMSLKASRVPSKTFATEAMKKWKQAIPRQMPMTAAPVMFIAAFMKAAVITNYWPTTTFRTTHPQTVLIIGIPPHVFAGTSFFVVIMFLAPVAIRVSGY